ncbi:S1 family peptidase [Catellatospora methionotrophica]|uniref:S1 family peptidase n=1 Tax=Catellatospora methionotrophica TaxID=121620 RepID=UPI0033E61B13
MFRRRRLVAGALALALATPLVPVAAAAAPAAPTGVDVFAEEAAGFAKDRGITEAEARQRMAWQLVAPDLDTRLTAELGSRYGGLWIDVRDGDRVTIGATAVDGGVQATVKAATAELGLSVYDLIPVKRSWERLSADNDWLAGEVIRVNAGSAVALSAGIRTDLNAVQLALPADGVLSAAQKAFVEAARARLGAGLVFGAAPGRGFAAFAGCVSPYCDPPLRGAVKINYPGVTSCTAGFVAQSKVDTKKYLVTAGHCAMGRTGNWWSKNAGLHEFKIGAVHRWIFDTYIGDMALIRIDDPSEIGWNPQPWVMVTWSLQTTENQTYHISSDNMSVVGMRICTTGQATRMSNCGHVTELGLTANLGGLPMRNLGRTTNCGKPGDSGAPMFASHVAYGILAGGVEGDCDTVYQGIRTAERELNVNILH